MPNAIRALVVDDSAFMRRAIKQMLESDREIEVVGVARDGREGLRFAKELEPDVITLDIEMPEMDGLTALRFIMREAPTQVLMLSSLTTEGSVASLQALKLGAADVLAKDASQFSANITKIQDRLLTVVRQLGRSRNRRAATATPKGSVPTPAAAGALPSFRRGQFDLVCIGASTGGPPVLETILSSLPAAFDTPIVIAQHMPEVFTKSMAKRLDDLCGQRVVHAESGMPIHKGWVFLAPGGRHTHVEKTRLAHYHIRVGDDPETAVYRPSVDALLSSAARATASRSLGVVLTGIGDDGVNGARAIHAAGGTILHQSEPTCVVYGMPKAVAGANISTAALSPADVGRALAALAGGTAAAA